MAAPAPASASSASSAPAVAQAQSPSQILKNHWVNKDQRDESLMGRIVNVAEEALGKEQFKQRFIPWNESFLGVGSRDIYARDSEERSVFWGIDPSQRLFICLSLSKVVYGGGTYFGRFCGERRISNCTILEKKENEDRDAKRQSEVVCSAVYQPFNDFLEERDIQKVKNLLEEKNVSGYLLRKDW